MSTWKPITIAGDRRVRLGTSLFLVVVLVAAMGVLQAAHAQTGTLLAGPFAPFGTGEDSGNGRGMAFDGTNLYITRVGDPNIYRISPPLPTGAVSTISVPPEDPRLSQGGPLTWDGSALWTVNYGNELILYRLNPSTGATAFSCNIRTANPESPALPGLSFPDGLHWTGISGSELVISGEIAGEFGRPTAVAFVSAANCTITSFFTFPQPNFAPECCSGVAFDGQTLWHATDGLKTVFRTTLGGTPTGLAISTPDIIGFEDLEFDAITFTPKCAIWGTTAGPPTVAAYEVPCAGALVANADTYSTDEDVSLAVPAPGVLANDTGGATSAELVATVEHGSLKLNADGSFTYAPSPNFNGTDTFFYVAKRGDIESNVATVTITVNAINDPPFFDPIADQFVSPPVNEPQTVAITGITPGPPDEASQIVTLSATSNNLLVSVSNPITTDGTVGMLTYRRTSTSTGTATITVKAQDNGGGTNTFTRSFDIVIGASGTVEANLTGFSPNPDPNKAPTVQVTVTARPIDFNGNGVIDVPGDCYRIFPPLTQRYNIVPSGADRSPEGPPWQLATKNPATGVVTDPGDTEEICNVARDFTASVDLSEWIVRSGEVTTNLDYVSLIRDLECLIDPTECVERIWTGTRPVGAITFTGGSGAKVADVNKVILHTVNTIGTTMTTSDAPIGGIVVRVFNRNDPAFQNQTFGGTQKIGKNPDGSFYDDIYESQVGQIATCTTPDSGVCIATESQAGDYLVIVKLVDKVQQKVVYDGLPKGVKDFVNGVVTKTFTIVKKFKNGVFQEYQAGTKTVVKDCTPTICP